MEADSSQLFSEDIRWVQRLSSFSRAFVQLRAGVDLAKERGLTDLERQGLIQAFEFTHELAWKVMKDFLVEHGVVEPIYGSKDATRAAFSADLIDRPETWMEMIASRNRTSHTYNEETAVEIEGLILNTFIGCFQSFEGTMTVLAKVEL